MSAPTYRSCPVGDRKQSPLSEFRKPPIIGSGKSSGVSLGSGGGGGNSFASSPGCPGERIINTNTSDFSRAWNVVEEWKCLPRIPPLYVLGATRTTVRGGGTPADLARRICDALRELSLDAIYDDGRAKAFVTSADGVEFFIRLFQDADLSFRGVVVEIQRKRGCAYRFHRYARSLLRAACGRGVAASGKSESSARQSRRSPSAALLARAARPGCLGGRVRSVPAMPAPTGADADLYSLDQALETADDLLRKDRIDANELGMESLMLLTDEESSGLERALYVSRALLCDDEDKLSDLKKVLVTHVVGFDDDDDEENEFDSRHNEVMHRNALTVMGNSLSVLAGNDSDCLRAIVRGDSWIGENGSLLPILVEELGRAETNPHNACEAARCLRAVLVAATEVARCRVKDLGAPAKLMVAQGVGQCRHAMLARESDAALVQL